MRLDWEEIDCIFVDMDDVDLPVMIPDLDIYRSAQVLVKRYDEAAPIHAAMRADALLEAGDLDGDAVWRRIIKAVEELQTAEPEPGVEVH